MTETTPFLEAIGQRILRRRQELRLSLSELAYITELSKAHVWAIEKGRSHPGAGTLWRLSRALRVEIDYLIAGQSPAWAAEGV